MAKPRSSKEVLAQAIDLFDETSWVQDEFERKDYLLKDGGGYDMVTTGYCAMGAIRKVNTRFQDAATVRLARAIRANDPRHYKRWARDWTDVGQTPPPIDDANAISGLVTTWNDQNGRTKRQVQQMFRKAIENG